MSTEKTNLTTVVETIKKNIKTFDRGVEGHIQDKVVLVLGSCKVGKTTLMNMIAGKEMKVFKEKGTVRLDVVDKNYAGEIKEKEGFLPMTIGHSADAKTQFPNYITVRHEGGSTQFWDCPGFFGETKESEVDISNMVYVHKILKHATAPYKGGVKFIVVESDNTWESGRAESFKNALKTICKIFPPVPVVQSAHDPQSIEVDDVKLVELIDATTFVFTKVDAESMKSDTYFRAALARITPPTSAPTQLEDTIYSKFLKKIQDLTREEPERIKYIKIPLVGGERMNIGDIQKDITAFIIPHVCNLDGHSIRSCSPKLVVDSSARDRVESLIQSCKLDLASQCKGQLTRYLTEIFQGMEKEAALRKIHEMFDLLPPASHLLNNGEATEVSHPLLTFLKTLYRGGGELRQVIEEIENTLTLFSDCKNIMGNTSRGADFPQIDFTPIMMAATIAGREYLIRAPYKAKEAQNAYDAEQQALTFLGKVDASLGIFQAILVTPVAPVLGPVMFAFNKLLSDHPKEDETLKNFMMLGYKAAQEYYREGFGALSQPKPLDKEKLVFLQKRADQLEAMLASTAFPTKDDTSQELKNPSIDVPIADMPLSGLVQESAPES